MNHTVVHMSNAPSRYTRIQHFSFRAHSDALHCCIFPFKKQKILPRHGHTKVLPEVNYLEGWLKIQKRD